MRSFTSYIVMNNARRATERTVPLKVAAYLTPGYFSRMSDVFVLNSCIVINSKYIEGYSTALKQKVKVERTAVRPLNSVGEIRAFIDTKYSSYVRYLIVLSLQKVEESDKYPYTKSYLYQCMLSSASIRNSIGGVSLVSDELLHEVDSKKLIISATNDLCYTMIDEKVNAISPINTYACRVRTVDFAKDKAYAAILNSNVFEYFWCNTIQSSANGTLKRIEKLGEIQVPKLVDRNQYILLSNLVDCISYLQQDNIMRIVPRMENYRLSYYLVQIMNMMVYELYFPKYVKSKGLDVFEYMSDAPFSKLSVSISRTIRNTYDWFQKPGNSIRQKLMLLDTRSPELLYPIHMLKK